MSATIAAIATPPAPGGIGIIRISGPEAIPVAARVFRSAGDWAQSPGYRAYYGKVQQDNTVFDEAICLVFRAPRSYTGEDVVEFSCHGGLYVTQRLLQAVLAAGAVPAAPGEFTKRAFLNGRMDFTQAEAVMALIAAQGKTAAQAALAALDGTLSQKIRLDAQLLLSACATLAAWVDFPDEDTEPPDEELLLSRFEQVEHSLSTLLDGFDRGRAATEGVDTVIVGRPNVGKSTLMNLLSGFERSIVTEYPGTTRDVVEETVRLGDLILRVADTAGIRESGNPVELLGVARAKERLARAQLVLAVFDGSEPLTEEDRALLSACQDKLCLAILNKADLPRQIELGPIRAAVDDVVVLSAASGEGCESLREHLERLLGTQDFDPGAARLANERQRRCCALALEALREAIAALRAGVTLDAVTVCVEQAAASLLELTGQRAAEAVVDEVFSQFCVGK